MSFESKSYLVSLTGLKSRSEIRTYACGSRLLGNYYYERCILDDSEICLENLWSIKQHPQFYRKNLQLNNIESTTLELKALCKDTVVVDLSAKEFRDLNSLRTLSQRVSSNNIHIICCTSPFGDNLIEAVNFMKNEFILGICTNVSGTEDSICFNVGAIFYPSISTSVLLEKDVYSITACLSLYTSLQCILPIFLDISSLDTSQYITLMSLLNSLHTNLSHVILNSLVISLANIDHILLFLTMNPDIKVCISGFGNVLHPSGPAPIPPTDTEIIQVLKQLLTKGFNHRLILTPDIKYKIQCSRWGGSGYSYLYSDILPLLEQQHGISSTDISLITCENLANILAWKIPETPIEVEIDQWECFICKKKFIPGKHYEKFSFVYCSSICLQSHRKNNWKDR